MTPQARPPPEPIQVEPEAGVNEESDGGGEDLTGYIVSIVGRRRYRRLHHLSMCGLIPGRDYREYVLYGPEAPPAEAYDAICARCWKSREVFDAEDPPASSVSSSGESECTGDAQMQGASPAKA